ncbi:hypothetical protein HN832_04290 [archaeon]|jgi:predicted phosphodiesterase|nr:hypothetical protein [archaeon]MBT4373386.1 hypothetical protein [archaeon]MBT4531834.1 hypothetical protein [archaeon]MBT7001501.1 hypothetical protein [archaeon]MBT7282607.1 hypothetical protein [archaeon]
MIKEVQYGVISDIHGSLENLERSLRAFKEKGIEKIILNGDLAEVGKSLDESQRNIAEVLERVGKSGLEAYVQPAGHDMMLAFESVMEKLGGECDNLINVNKPQKVEADGHDLVFLPGADFGPSTGSYKLGDDARMPSGNYLMSQEGITPFGKLEEYVVALKEGKQVKGINYTNINDLKRLVTNPDKTIVFCHVPRKFKGIENCVDVTKFGEVTEDFLDEENHLAKGTVIPLPHVERYKAAGVPVEVKTGNRGNEGLAKLYKELGIKKAISGHFHGTGHRATNANGEVVEEGKYTDELFWNSGCLSSGQTGILTVRGKEVSYENVELEDYK